MGWWIAILLVVSGGLIVIGVREHNKWEDWCESQGGHVISNSSVGTGVSPDGKPVTTTTTTYYCLSADGRILDIQ